MLLLALLLLAVQNPKQAQELWRKGLIELQQNRLPGARLNFEAAVKLDPQNALIRASLAQTYWRLNAKAEALRSAETAEKLGAGNGIVAHTLAIFYREAGAIKRAAAFERVYARSAGADPDALSRAALLSLEAGEPQEAFVLAQRAADQNGTPTNRNLLGRIQLASGQPAAALSNLYAAFSASPKDEQFCFDYAQALLQQRDFAGAIRTLEQGLEQHPRSAQLQLALGVAQYGQRQFDNAIDTFLKTIQIDPSVEQSYIFLGRMLDQAGERLPEITKSYQSWHTKQPGNPFSSLLLAKALSAGDSESTTIEELLRRSIRLKGDLWEAHLELGIVLSKQRKFAEAAVELDRSAKLNAKEPLPHYHLARVYDRLGQGEKATRERELHAQLSAEK